MEVFVLESPSKPVVLVFKFPPRRGLPSLRVSFRFGPRHLVLGYPSELSRVYGDPGRSPGLLSSAAKLATGRPSPSKLQGGAQTKPSAAWGGDPPLSFLSRVGLITHHHVDFAFSPGTSLTL